QARAQIQVDQYKEWLDAGMSLLEVQALINLTTSAAISSTSLGGAATALSTTASIFSALASYESKREEWEFQQRLAEQDVAIGAQQVTVSNDNVRIVDQELTIARTQVDHDADTVNFLANKFTSVELYDWMSNVLQGVYSFFLQQATATAQLAAAQ